MTLLLGEGVNLDATLNPVTDGWAGDSFVTWTSGAASCIRIDTRSDTAPQSDALRGALTTWASSHGAIVSAVDATTARVTACN